MRQNMATAMLCAVLGSGAFVTLAAQPAEAGDVLSRLRSHGLGKWVDKYVEEDKTGKMLYKPASQDNYSANYYDSKTGKWTGKKDGAGLEKTSSLKSAKKNTASLSTVKTGPSTRTAALTASKRKKPAYSAVALNAAEEKTKDVKAAESQVEPVVNPNVKNSVAAEPVSVATPEMYGPPAPEQGIASAIN